MGASLQYKMPQREEFYPGLILWCDPNCYEMDLSTLGPDEVYDRKKARELRPCLVVAVNYTAQSFQVARLCATTPRDTRRWVRIDSAPQITWRLPTAWIWVATPPTVAMVFNNAKAMHPHKDIYYTSNPVAASNLQNYWVHRQSYLSWHPTKAASSRHGAPSASAQASSSASTMTSPYTQPAGSALYSTNPSRHHHSPAQSTSAQPNYFSQIPQSGGVASGTAYPPGLYADSGYEQTQAGFNTLSAQPVVVPAGFTETHPARPGWWRNPESGWFWNASRGLLPPTAPR
ncbi:hypothetical protein DFH09DRAFT_1283598 [Mycena vulgaris]|nr:hypothetical protein DFH09DRAFT_1283598 [Mycena vulgaris]